MNQDELKRQLKKGLAKAEKVFSQIPKEEKWIIRLSKYYGAMFECGDFEKLLEDVRSEIESSYSKGLEAGRKEILVMLGIINEMEDSPQKREQIESLLSSSENKEK